MANEWLAEGFLQLGLGAAWSNYAAALMQDSAAYRTLGERLRRDVVEPFLCVEWVPGIRDAAGRGDEAAYPTDVHLEPPTPPLMTLAWIHQARAVHAWRLLANEADELHRIAVRQRQWAELRTECNRVRQELDEAQQKQSRFQALMGSGNLARLANAASAVLERCQQQLAESADAEAGTRGRYSELEQKIRQLLDRTSSDWLPARLVQLQQSLASLDRERYGGLLARLSPGRSAPAVWTEWDRYLQRELPAIEPTLRARLLLLRAVLDVLNDPFSPDLFWERFDDAVRPLFASGGLEVQLLRDSQQQTPEGFVAIADPSLESPRRGRVGCAVRPLGRDAWTFYPRAEQYVPESDTGSYKSAQREPSTPEERALAELDALVRAAETLALAESTDAATEGGVNYGHLDGESARQLEQQWTDWRDRWQPDGFDALPSQWTFLRPLSWNDLELTDENLSPVFRGTISRGIIYRMKTFGMRRGDETIRPCLVYVSAGPAPVGFSELYQLVEPAKGSSEEALKQRLRGWPAACLQDALGVAAVRLYLDFWGSVGEEMRQQRPAAAHEFGEHLARLLRQELGLETFHPESYQDYPDGWLLLASDQGAVTGQVRRVLRPGLKDEQGNLHVPAVVDVE